MKVQEKVAKPKATQNCKQQQASGDGKRGFPTTPKTKAQAVMMSNDVLTTTNTKMISNPYEQHNAIQITFP
jgi:hypothetical protein